MGDVPFWLQLAAVVLAPLLGLAGVLYGAWWSARAEERRWLRQERRLTYGAYLRAVNELSRDFALHVTRAAAARDRARFNDALTAFNAAFIEWERAQGALTIIASPKVNEAAGPVLGAFAMTEDLVVPYADQGAPMPDFDAEKWARCSAALIAAIDGFTVAARSDLGV